MAVQPIIGQWYHYPGKSQKFKVVALDLSDDTIEIQYFDGTIDEIECLHGMVCIWKSLKNQRTGQGLWEVLK